MAAAGGASGTPITASKVLSLSALGVQGKAINVKTTSMTSHKAILIREDNGGKGQLSTVDPSEQRIKSKHALEGDAACQSPNGKLLSARGKGIVQIRNLEIGKKIKSTKVFSSDKISYWRWLNDTTLAIVASKAVYHWSSEGGSEPEKMFDRSKALLGAQVINYDASADGKWLVASGMAKIDGAVQGVMQLYSVEHRKSQKPITSAAGCFTKFKVAGRASPAMLFCYVQQPAGSKPTLRIVEVGYKGADAHTVPEQTLPLPAGSAGDMAVVLQASEEQGILYIFTRMGLCFVFDLETGNVIFRTKVAETPIFTACAQPETGGVLALAMTSGDLHHVQINRDALVGYVMGTLKNESLALKLAGRLSLPGAEAAYKGQMDRLLASSNIEGAADLAASSPGEVLRNSETIRRIQGMPDGARQLLVYLTRIAKKGQLNAVESIELARPALAQNRLPLIQKWVREGKMTSSAELGDLIAPHDSTLAKSVYENSGGAHDKVVGCFVQAGDVDKIIPYAKEHAYQPDWATLLQQLVHTHPDKSAEFAQTLVKNSPGPLIQIDTAVDIFMQFKRLPECTSFLYDVLSEDRKEQGYLQTRLLEMNMLGGAAPVADAILGSNTFHHFDKKHIATLAERCGLYHRALELHEDVEDMKRVIPNVARDPKHRAFLVKFFSTLVSEDALTCVSALLDTKQVDEAVVEIAKQYSDFMGPENLIKMFEDRKSTNALYYYLAGIVNTSESPEVHFKYIQVAAELNQPDEVLRVCRDSTVYNPEEVKDYLIQKKLPNPQPLIWVCDRHGFVPELTHYLHTNKLQRFLEVYVLKVSPKSCPLVIGKLLDLDADEKFIMNLISQVPTGPVPQHMPEGAPEPNVCDIGELVQEVEKRNRLKMLERFLDAKIAGGNNEPATHNAMGKIVIMANKDPKDFLTKNTFYDPKVLGKFAERLDPQLAFLAYKRGNCDEELLEVSNKNGLFKQQARYLVERRDEELWARVLNEENPHRQDLIDQVVGTALPEIKDGELVSVTVKAFIDADVPQQLIGLLEKLVLHGTEFAHHTKLQNLLLATAIRCSHSDESGGRFMEYINRLDNFDPERIASMALRDDYELFEEAFTIYKKFDMPMKAVAVLIERLHDLERAFGYAERVDKAEVWTMLANAQLADKMVKEAVDSFIKADDASNFSEVIAVARGEEAFEDLVRYLQMARKSKKEREVDSELAYAFAQCKRLSDLEVFVSEPNVADIQGIGDRCYSEGLFDAGRILFAAIDNNAQLAACYVQLGQYNEAVQAAKKANSSKTWKELNKACMAAGEFRLAQQCGLNIMTDPDHLEELVHTYEQGGHFEELIKLLETGIGAEGAHQGIFTELGVVYSRHLPEKLMNHLKVFKSRLNVPKILRACEAGRHWPEAAFLHVETDDFDNGVKVMIDHSPTAFDHDRFKEIIRKVRNPELYYQAVEFYLREEPMQLNDLLKVLAPMLDHSRVVHILRKDQFHMRLALPYLLQVQSNDITAVNEAVNATLVKLEDYERLRTSIDEHQTFDQLDLAKKLESHELVEFQRIAAVLYRRNRRFESSIELSKKSGMFRDAIETAAASRDVKLVEALVRYFVEEKGDAECFSACLYACYGLVRPDVALELAWRYRLIDYVMPYLVQYLGDQDAKIRELDARTAEKEEEEEQAMGQGMAGGIPMLGGQVPQLANFAANSQPGGYPQGYPQGSAPGPGYGGMGGPGMGGQFGGM